MNRFLSGSIALTKLKHHMLTLKGKEGKPVKGIFIPVDPNHNILTKGKEDTWYLDIRVMVRDEADQYDQHGFISQSVPGKIYKDATEQQKEEFKKLPILGNLKDFSDNRDNEGNMGNATLEEIPEENGDLPF